MSSSPAPYFSIVIPVYNRSQQITPTLMSVLRQSFEDFECVIVDDGSDDSVALESRVNEMKDNRFRYFRQDNAGGGAARNTGILEARGKYIAFLDSDDLFLETKLEVVRDFLERTGSEAVYSRAYVDRGVKGRLWIRPDRPIGYGEDVGEYLFVSNQFIPTPTIVMRADLARANLFDPTLRKGQDLDFCVRAHARGVRFCMIEQPLVTWIDISEAGRASRHSGAAAPTAWLRSVSNLLSKRAQRGYRATVLAYYQPKWKFPLVLWDLAIGWLVAGVPIRVISRQLLRFALPRSIYRAVADFAVRVRGVSVKGPSDRSARSHAVIND